MPLQVVVNIISAPFFFFFFDFWKDFSTRQSSHCMSRNVQIDYTYDQGGRMAITQGDNWLSADETEST